jgi:hypothetical protein
MVEEPVDGTLKVRIEPESDDDAHFALAQNVWINHDANHFYLRFYQIVPPLPSATLPESVKGRLMATVAVPAAILPDLIQALTDNAHNWEKSTGKSLEWNKHEEG